MASLWGVAAGVALGGIGYCVKSNAAANMELAHTMDRTPTTPIAELGKLLQSGAGSELVCEMSGETHAIQEFEYKQQKVLGIVQETLRVFKSFDWVKPKRDEAGHVLKPGHWRGKDVEQTMCEDLTGTKELTFREAGTASKIRALRSKLGSLDREVSASVVGLQAQRERQRHQEELDQLLEAPVVRVEPSIDTSQFWEHKGEAFEAAQGGTNVNVQVNSSPQATSPDPGPQPPDQPLGTRSRVRVLPQGLPVYALGTVRPDRHHPGQLLFSKGSGAFMLDKGLESELKSALQAQGASQELLGNILMGAAGVTVLGSVISMAVSSNSKD